MSLEKRNIVASEQSERSIYIYISSAKFSTVDPTWSTPTFEHLFLLKTADTYQIRDTNSLDLSQACENAAGWKAFYDANNGAIPIECHAGRAAMGGEAQETHLVRIGDEESHLRMLRSSLKRIEMGKHLKSDPIQFISAALSSFSSKLCVEARKSVNCCGT